MNDKMKKQKRDEELVLEKYLLTNNDTRIRLIEQAQFGI
jgi:hypothetical protein